MFVRSKHDLRTVNGIGMLQANCALCGLSEGHAMGTLYQATRFRTVLLHLACQYEAMETICEEVGLEYERDHPLIRLLTRSGRHAVLAQWQWDGLEIKQMGFDADGNQIIALVRQPKNQLKGKPDGC